MWSPGLKHKHCCWQCTCLTHAPGCTVQNMHPSGGSLMGDGQKTNFRSYTDGALMGAQKVGTKQWCHSTISKYWTRKYCFWDVTSKQPQVQTHLGELAHVGFNQLQRAVCQPNQWSVTDQSQPRHLLRGTSNPFSWAEDCTLFALAWEKMGRGRWRCWDTSKANVQ